MIYYMHIQEQTNYFALKILHLLGIIYHQLFGTLVSSKIENLAPCPVFAVGVRKQGNNTTPKPPPIKWPLSHLFLEVLIKIRFSCSIKKLQQDLNRRCYKFGVIVNITCEFFKPIVCTRYIAAFQILIRRLKIVFSIALQVIYCLFKQLILTLGKIKIWFEPMFSVILFLPRERVELSERRLRRILSPVRPALNFCRRILQYS